jgi:hypothetical protein
VLPPDAITKLLYAAPTVPAGSEVVVTARLVGWLEFAVLVLPVPPSQFPHGLARPDAKPESVTSEGRLDIGLYAKVVVTT